MRRALLLRLSSHPAARRGTAQSLSTRALTQKQAAANGANKPGGQEQLKVEPNGCFAAVPQQWIDEAGEEAYQKACQGWDRPDRRASIMAAMQRALECTACSWRGASKGCRQCLREWEPFYRLTVPGYEFWVGQKVPEQWVRHRS